MNTHDLETVLRSYLTGDGYVRHEHQKKCAAGGAVAEAIRTHLGVKND